MPNIIAFPSGANENGPTLDGEVWIGFESEMGLYEWGGKERTNSAASYNYKPPPRRSDAGESR